MGFFSILKLSLHSLLNNKLRTLLTIVVISVVSFVIVFLFGVGYSFYRSVNLNMSAMFNENGETLYINAEKMVGNSSYTVPLSLEDIETIIEKINIDEGYISYISFFNFDYGYLNGRNIYGIDKQKYGNSISIYPFYENSNPFVGMDNYIAAGRMWNSSDKNSLNIWLSSSSMKDYSIGDTMELEISYYEGSDWKNEIMGIFTVTGFIELPDSNNYYGNIAFIPYTHFDASYTFSEYNAMDNKLITNMYIGLVPQQGELYGIETQNYFSKLMDSVNGQSSTYGTFSAYGRVISTLKMVLIMVLVLLGVALFISLLIILLSIGSVANTIKISAEQNRRFFGMMKAIGMNNRSVRSILTGQIILMAVLGTGIAYGVSLLLIGSAYSVIDSLISGMFYGITAEIVCVISPVIPVCVAAAFIGFVLLFSRTSLREISHMDVITVINEVN
jgi:ABC-type antimicrobial peptide transport system permease subunit